MILPKEKQVCSLEWAKKMRDLDFEQDSLWYWSVPRSSDRKFYSAYTIAEILKLIYDILGTFTVLYDKDLKPEKIANYLAEIVCNLKEED